MLPLTIQQIEGLIGYKFQEKKHLEDAYNHEQTHTTRDKLALVGDQALRSVVTDWLYLNFPDSSVGDMTKWRTNIESGTSCERYAQDLGLTKYYQGQQKPHSQRTSGTLFESVIGAIHIDGGFDLNITKRIMLEKVEEIWRHTIDDNRHHTKNLLQEQNTKRYPVYRTKFSGPDHNRRYVSQVEVVNGLVAQGSYQKRKKDAEKSAAGAMLKFTAKMSSASKTQKNRNWKGQLQVLLARNGKTSENNAVTSRKNIRAKTRSAKKCQNVSRKFLPVKKKSPLPSPKNRRLSQNKIKAFADSGGLDGRHCFAFGETRPLFPFVGKRVNTQVKAKEMSCDFDLGLWNTVEQILKSAKNPVNSLFIRSSIQHGQPTKKEINRLLYTQMKLGNLNKVGNEGERPKWKLSGVATQMGAA